MVHELIGEYDCWSCGKTAPVKRTATGKLKAACEWCDFPNYANQGTKHYANLLAKTRLFDKPAPAAEPREKDPPRTAPAAPPKRSFTTPLFGSKA